ncbi:hypothetical protein B0H12DRAFT_1225734 [Mycena haematopus]|nr:hypothetical protein B0H12DRAFT_1225734 [Mycena haematopus]
MKQKCWVSDLGLPPVPVTATAVESRGVPRHGPWETRLLGVQKNPERDSTVNSTAVTAVSTGANQTEVVLTTFKLRHHTRKFPLLGSTLQRATPRSEMTYPWHSRNGRVSMACSGCDPCRDSAVVEVQKSSTERARWHGCRGTVATVTGGSPSRTGRQPPTRTALADTIK